MRGQTFLFYSAWHAILTVLAFVLGPADGLEVPHALLMIGMSFVSGVYLTLGIKAPR